MLTWNRRNDGDNVPGKVYLEGECLSTDTKPTSANIMNGSKLLEMDTSTLYIYDAENGVWREWT